FYSAAWAFCGYPQIFLNYKRKSVRGLSVDFMFLSTLGFVCYSLYNVFFCFSPELRTEYQARKNGHSILVMPNDVFFSVHSLCQSLIVLYQYKTYEKDPSQRLSYPAKILIFSTVFVLLLVLSLKSLFDFLILASYLKLVLTVTKYIPQVYTNYKRKSTDGWSVTNVILDLTGGFFSNAQLVVDALSQGSIMHVFDNPAKLVLALISICFDALFLTQHYFLYSGDFKHGYKYITESSDSHNAFSDLSGHLPTSNYFPAVHTAQLDAIELSSYSPSPDHTLNIPIQRI
ncbi:hypothetical protein BB560_003001, partial [Smittium megazygosporum]